MCWLLELNRFTFRTYCLINSEIPPIGLKYPPTVTYVLAVLAALLVAAGYFLGARRGRSREAALKTTLDERSEKLTLAEHELLRRSSIDPVTELPTQQYFQDFLEREWRRSSRERTTVSLIMIEIDHFRAYHERLGKPDADACLRAVADAMRPIIHRPGDTLARYGGSGKFGVVLGGTDAKGAMLLAERLRQSVEKLQKSHPASPSGPIVTLSIGVAAAMPDREGAWQDIELIAMAENGLSRAKEAGRNRVSLDRASQPTTSG
jgi:diguanylate cyclase (GGDEF)-like protein